MKMIFTILLACASISTQAQDWVKVASGDSYTYFIQEGSVEIAKTRSGRVIVVGVGKTTDLKTNRHTGELWYVTENHCALGRGELVTLNPSGEFKHTNDFVNGLGTVASNIAEILCGVGRTIDRPSNGPNV